MLLYKYRQKNLFAFLTATFLMISLCFPGLIQAQAYKFSNIVIVGNLNIETQTVDCSSAKTNYAFNFTEAAIYTAEQAYACSAQPGDGIITTVWEYNFVS